MNVCKSLRPIMWQLMLRLILICFLSVSIMGLQACSTLWRKPVTSDQALTQVRKEQPKLPKPDVLHLQPVQWGKDLDKEGNMTGVSLNFQNFRNMSYNMAQILRWMQQAKAYMQVCH